MPSFDCKIIPKITSQKGYEFKLNFLKNCADDNVLTVGASPEVVLDENCDLIPKGCVEAKAFTSNKASFV